MPCEYCGDHWECSDDPDDLCKPGRWLFTGVISEGVYTRQASDGKCAVKIEPLRRRWLQEVVIGPDTWARIERAARLLAERDWDFESIGPDDLKPEPQG